jgi:hypothetical protein
MHRSQGWICVAQTYWSHFRIIEKEIGFVFSPNLSSIMANSRLGKEQAADPDRSQFRRTCDQTGAYRAHNPVARVDSIKALVTAHNRSDDESFEKILLSTVGVIFLGTPHRGAHSAQLGVILSQAANFFGASWKEGILQALKYESKEVLSLDKEFAWISPSKELVCFYETQETQWMGLVRGFPLL